MKKLEEKLKKLEADRKLLVDTIGSSFVMIESLGLDDTSNNKE